MSYMKIAIWFRWKSGNDLLVTPFLQVIFNDFLNKIQGFFFAHSL